MNETTETTTPTTQATEKPKPPPPHIRMVDTDAGGKALIPDDFDGVWRLAVAYHRSGLKSRNIQNTEQWFLVLCTGFEVGLSPARCAKSIYIVNDVCCIYGDDLLGLCRRHKTCESILEEYTDGDGNPITTTRQINAALEKGDLTARCTCIRRGEPHPIVRTFSMDDAKQAGLWEDDKKAWGKYGIRMLQMRARCFGCRDAFPDALGGLSIVEEAVEGERRRVPNEAAQESAQRAAQATERAKAAHTPHVDPAAAAAALKQLPTPEPPVVFAPPAPTLAELNGQPAAAEAKEANRKAATEATPRPEPTRPARGAQPPPAPARVVDDLQPHERPTEDAPPPSQMTEDEYLRKHGEPKPGRRTPTAARQGTPGRR